MCQRLYIFMFAALLGIVSCSSSANIHEPTSIPILTIPATAQPLVEPTSPPSMRIPEEILWGEAYIVFRTTNPPFSYQLGVLDAQCLFAQKQTQCPPIKIISGFPGDISPISDETLIWSPDGSKALMLYDTQLLSFDPKTQTFTPLLNPILISNDRMKWSFDNEWILVTVQGKEAYQDPMVLINTETGEKRDIPTSLTGTHYPIGWTTSQELIFLLGQFEADPGGSDLKQKLTAVYMYTYNVPSGQMMELGENQIWGANLPALSLDGSKIAFVTKDQRNPPLTVMNSDGTNSQIIGEYGTAPIWSPNGEWIATTDLDENLDTSIVYVVHPDGTNGQAIFQGKGVLPSVFWLPDNQYLLVTTYDDENDGKFLYLVSIQEGNVQPVTIPGIDPNQYVLQGISLRPLPSAP